MTRLVEEKPDSIAIASPPSEWKDADKFEPFFTIYLALPTNTFQRLLQANPETRLVHLWIDTTVSGKKACVMAIPPVGMNLSGDLKKKNYAHVGSITLMIKPRPEIALDSKPSPEMKPKAPPVPEPVFVNSSDQTRSTIRHLFWAAVRRMLR